MSEIRLFPDQQETIDNLRGSLRRNKWVLMQCPTGWGKTVGGAYLIKSALDKGKKAIFTVPRKELLRQTSLTLEKFGIPHSYIAAGRPFNPYAKIYIGMVETLARRVGKIPKVDLVIVDETHFGSGSLGAVIDHFKEQGAFGVGLSATPWKLNGKGLGCWYDDMVQGQSIRWLIDNKRLSDYELYAGRTRPDLSGIKVAGGDYAKGELSDFMEHQGVIIGDCVSEYRSRCMGRLHIVRAVSIKHSQMIAESFRNEGVPAAHVDGTTEADELKKIVRAYARRELKVLTFCELLGFGFDLSAASGMDVCIESGSDLRPSKSLSGQMQYWGRMLRYKDYPAIINDHVNNFIEHGLPCDDRDWTLHDRVQGKRNTERAPPTRQCDSCFHIHSPAPQCPKCGHVYEVKYRDVDEVDGQLEKVDKEVARKSKRMEQGKAETLDDLIALGLSRGYKNPVAWATHILSARMQKEMRAG